MTTTGAVWLMIALTAVGSFSTRASFFLILRNPESLTPRVRRALSLVPPAAFAALVAPIVLKPEGNLEPVSAEAATALVALVLGRVTGSLGATIFAGLALYTLLHGLGL